MNSRHCQINTKKVRQTKIKSLLVILLLVCALDPAMGQQTKSDQSSVRMANIYLIAQTSADSVVLRWAPSTAGGWIIANNLGYTLERIEIVDDVEIDDAGFVRLTSAPLKPLSLDDWKAFAGADNRLSAIAAQAIYGKSFVPEPLKQGELSALKNAADELTNRYSFSLFAADNDAVTASAMGLRYVDKNVKTGGRYAYRVFVAAQTAEYAYDTAYVVVDVEEMPKWPAPSMLNFESGDGTIKLTWNESDLQSYSGYYIYRSDNGGTTYSKMNELPLVIVTPANDAPPSPYYNDTLTVNYRNYHYRVFGITPFGELSLPAEIIAFSKDLTPPAAPKINKPQQISSSQVKISWTMEQKSNDLQGFYVSRSADPIDGFRFIHKKALSAKTFEFIDDIKGETETYYTVAAVDTAGNLGFSSTVMAILIDTIPPSIPKNLKGIIDANGKVTLSWSLGKEKNIIGYRVLRANDPSHEFIQLIGHVHPDTMYVDSIDISTLTRYVYYKIAAVNNRFQHSALSPILKLKRPDMIAPGEAVFYDLFVADSCVNLSWHCSSSSDVAKQLLYRQKESDKKWTLLETLSPGVSFYSDKKVSTNIKYYYTITSIDSSGLVSAEAFPVSAKPYDTGKRKAVENLKVSFNQQTKLVQLNWDYWPAKDEKHWFVIYKAIGGGAYKEYKAVKAEEKSFTDQFSIKGQSGYGVVVMTSNGGESDMVTSSIRIEAE